MGKVIALDQVNDELQAIYGQFIHATFEKRQEALQAAAEVCCRAMETASPTDTGEYASQWVIKTAYYDRRYVGNKKTVKGADHNIPLSNILEYSTIHGHPFIQATLDANAQAIFKAFKESLEKGGN